MSNGNSERPVGALANHVGRKFLVGAAFGVALMLWGCDAGEAVTYTNSTSKDVYVRINDQSNSKIPAGTSRTISHLASTFGSDDDPLRFVVTDESGCVLLVFNTTLEAFKQELDLTFTITPIDIPSPEERTDCEQPP